jgi:hypothetical protein
MRGLGELLTKIVKSCAVSKERSRSDGSIDPVSPEKRQNESAGVALRPNTGRQRGADIKAAYD